MLFSSNAVTLSLAIASANGDGTGGVEAEEEGGVAAAAGGSISTRLLTWLSSAEAILTLQNAKVCLYVQKSTLKLRKKTCLKDAFLFDETCPGGGVSASHFTELVSPPPLLSPPSDPPSSSSMSRRVRLERSADERVRLPRDPSLSNLAMIEE